jgi:mannosyltransferase
VTGLFVRVRALGERPLVPIVGLAAALRFTELDARGFWRDEAVTVALVRKSFGGMLSAIPHSEGTPPLYYVLAWVWTRLFGTSEAGLRSLSALLGTATVVVVYAIGVELVSRRVALAAALLTAVNPLMVWQSQDGRSYALFALLGATSFLMFVRASRLLDATALVLWAMASGLALATHYFAMFLVVPEAIWLLGIRQARRRVAVATLAVSVVGLGLLPLALAQRSDASVAWISEIALWRRLRELGEQFLVGPQAPATLSLTALEGACVVAAVALLLGRTTESERRALRLPGAIALGTVAFALLFSLVGIDYFLSRNLVVAWVPLAVVVAAGLAGRRAGFLGGSALAALVVVGVVIVISTAHKPKFGGEDWRGAAHALGAPGASRAVVLWLGVGAGAFELYRPEATPMPPVGATVSEVDVVSVGVGHADIVTRRANLYPPDPFRQIGRVDSTYYMIIRFRSAEPRLVRRATLVSGGPGYSAAVLLDQR